MTTQLIYKAFFFNFTQKRLETLLPEQGRWEYSMKDSLNKAVMGNLQWPEKQDEKWDKKKKRRDILSEAWRK